MFNSILPVPAPVVSVFHGEGATAFAGSQLTLTCSIVLDSTLFSILGDLVVTSMWSGPGSGMLSSGGRITVSPASRQGVSTTFASQVLFNTLRTSDAGSYTCQATVAPQGSTAGTVINGVGSANAATPTIQGMCISYQSCVCYIHNVHYTVLHMQCAHLTILSATYSYGNLYGGVNTRCST